MRTCQCAGCDTLKECELVGQNWLCGACIAALSTPPEVTITGDDGARTEGVADDGSVSDNSTL